LARFRHRKKLIRGKIRENLLRDFENRTILSNIPDIKRKTLEIVMISSVSSVMRDQFRYTLKIGKIES